MIIKKVMLLKYFVSTSIQWSVDLFHDKVQVHYKYHSISMNEKNEFYQITTKYSKWILK